MIFVGLDLHKRYITACAVDAEGTIVAAARRLPADAADCRAGIVSLLLVARARTAGRRAHSAGRRSAPGEADLASSDQDADPIDAHNLAELARANVLPALWVPDPGTRARRQALRGRSFLVRQRTVFKNRVHAYLTSENLHCPTVDLYGKGGRAWLDTVALPGVVRRHVTLLLANIDQLSTQIRALDQELMRSLTRDVSQRLAKDPRGRSPGRAVPASRTGPRHALPRCAAPRGVPRAHAGYAQFRREDAAWSGGAGKPMAQMHRDRNPAAAQAGAWPGGRALSEAAPADGEAEGDGGRGAEVLHVPVLDVQRGADLY